MRWRIKSGIILLLVVFLTISAGLWAKGKEQKIDSKAKKFFSGANISKQQGFYEKALGQYLEVLKIQPNHVESLVNVSVLYFMSAEEDDDIDMYVSANEYAKRTIVAIEGTPNYKTYEKFEEHLESSTILLQRIYKNIFDLGKDLFDEEDLDAAEPIFERLTQISPERFEAYLVLVQIAKQREDEAKVLELYTQLGEVASDNPGLLMTVGSGFEEEKDYANALHYYQMYIDKKPEDSIGYLAIAQVYWDREDFNEAFRYFELANGCDPDNKDIVVNMLITAQKLDNSEKQIELGKRWVEIEETQESLGSLWDILVRNKQYQESLEYGKRLYNLDTTNIGIVQEIISIARIVGDSATVSEFTAILQGK